MYVQIDIRLALIHFNSKWLSGDAELNRDSKINFEMFTNKKSVYKDIWCDQKPGTPELATVRHCCAEDEAGADRLSS